tara:strand:- start:1737 stop:2516 length:780 start_codon:yes stop_codon:yes gene_type:complete
VADELSREEVKDRLEAIFRSSLEGKELDKALASIEKRLDKFEGKWDGLIKWAETKHGKPAESEEPTEVDQAEPEEKPKKKRRGLFGRGRKKADPEPEESESEPEEDQQEGLTPEEPPTSEMSREAAAANLEEIFKSSLEGEELEKMIESIPKRLDKFEGKWPKLLLWAEGKYGGERKEAESDQEESDSAAEEVGTKVDIESTLELIIKGDSEAALSNLKMLIGEDPSNPDIWRGLSSYFSSVGMSGRSNACEEKAEALS